MPKQQFEYITDRAVKGMFYAALEAGDNSWARRLAFVSESDQASEDYGWIGMPPQLSEWVGDRSVDELREFTFRLNNKDHQATLRIRDKDMRRDKTGQLRQRINGLASRANDYPAKLLSTLILNGEATTCYDGQYFFDTDHAEGDSGTQSNDLTSAIVAAATPTTDEFQAALLGAVQAMYGFKDDRGEPINGNARSFDVMVPVPYMRAAMTAISAPLIGGGNSNIITAQDSISFNLVVNPRLTWTTKFAVFRNDGDVKPFILQQETAPEPEVLGPGSDHYFKNKEWLIGMDWSGNVGYGAWQAATLHTFTTA